MSRWTSLPTWAIRSSSTPSPCIVSVSKRTAYCSALSSRTSRFSRSCLRGTVTVVITRRLLARTFTEVANGDGAPVIVGYPHEAQRGKHLMLLHAVAEGTNAAGPVSPAVAATHAGSKLPMTEQLADPCNVAWLSSLLHIGGCPHDCLVRLNPGLPPEFSYRACAVATPALWADARFAGRAAEGHQSIPRLINASDVRRSVGRRGHELAVLHQVCLACNRAALQLVVRTGGRRLSDRPAHPVSIQCLPLPWR